MSSPSSVHLVNYCMWSSSCFVLSLEIPSFRESEDTMLLMLKELYAVNGVDPDETSSAHPINNWTTFQSSDAAAAIEVHQSTSGLRPNASSDNVSSVALTDALQRECQTNQAVEPARPFVGVNPSSFPASSAISVSPMFPVQSSRMPAYKDPSPPLMAPPLAGPSPLAPPLLPPVGAPTAGSHSSVVVSDFDPTATCSAICRHSTLK